MSNSPIVGQCCVKMLYNALSNCLMDSVVSNCPNIVQSSVKQSQTVQWTVLCPIAIIKIQYNVLSNSLCPTVQLLVNAVSNCLMASELSGQQFNGRTVLCPTVQWSGSAVSNSSMVSQCYVKLSNGWSAQCSTV